MTLSPALGQTAPGKQEHQSVQSAESDGLDQPLVEFGSTHWSATADATSKDAVGKRAHLFQFQVAKQNDTCGSPAIILHGIQVCG